MLQIENGTTGPVVICDHCGSRIVRADDGNAQWTWDDPAVRFTHKGCCRSFESTHGAGSRWLYQPLSAWLVYLGSNARLDRATAEESARLLSSI